MRGSTAVPRVVTDTAGRLDYPNELGLRKFDKSDCSDNQTCMRMLPKNTATDLGNGY
jgi:hypothetical protein